MARSVRIGSCKSPGALVRVLEYIIADIEPANVSAIKGGSDYLLLVDTWNAASAALSK